MAWIEVLNGPDNGRTHSLQGEGPWHLGCAPSCEIVLRGPGLADEHARLVLDGTRYTLEDLGSDGGCHVDGTWTGARAVSVGDETIVELGMTLCRMRLQCSQGRLGLSRRQLFAMASDEVCRDGRVEDWEEDVLARLAAALKVDEARTKALLERSMQRYQQQQLGEARRFDPRALYLKAQARALHPPTNEESQLLRALLPLFELGPRSAAVPAEDHPSSRGWSECQERLVVRFQPHPGKVDFVRGVSWRSHPATQLPLTVAWDFQTGQPLVRYQVDRAEGVRRVVAYGVDERIVAVHLRVRGPALDEPQPGRAALVELLGRLSPDGRRAVKRLVLSHAPDPNEAFWMVKSGRGHTLLSLNQEMLIVYRPRAGFPPDDVLLLELEAAWRLLGTSGPTDSRRLLRPQRDQI